MIGIGLNIGNRVMGGGGAPAFVGLLDDYPNAAAAYSLRLLKSDYTGNAIRVRRSSDNAEQNIGFSGANLDTSALTTFCSGTDGFVTTWYDQSGSGNNATQTTAASQPKIYDSVSGVIEENGKPAISAIATYSLDLSSIINVNSLFAVTKNTTTSPVHYLLWNTAPNEGFFLGGTSPSILDNIGLFKSILYLSGVLNNDIQNLINFNYDTNYSFGLNNNASVDMPTALNLVGINRIQRQGFGIVGSFQEIVIYNSDESSNRSGISTNINDFYSIY